MGMISNIVKWFNGGTIGSFFYNGHKRIHKIENDLLAEKKAKMNLHPVRNKNVVRGSDGRFKKKETLNKS